jgi:hypothetical protein
MSAGSELTRRAGAWCLAVLGCLSLFACTSSDEATPEPSRPPPLNTIEASEVGDRLTLTASVADVPGEGSFVVRDADLPDEGLLVLSGAEVQVPALVTVEGTIERFAFDRFGERYGLTDAAAYRRFDGGKILVADEVRSWASARNR